MGDIDWNKLYDATSESDQPTPGYVVNEIVYNVSCANPGNIPAVAEYLATCVDGDHAHVKLKALLVIKALAYRIPPFRDRFQERAACIQAASTFSGPPSAIFGDEPYRLIRDAAAATYAILTEGRFYHEEHRELSQRIVGFGNYLPGEDTVHADGSINIERASYIDVFSDTVSNLFQNSFGTLFAGRGERIKENECVDENQAEVFGSGCVHVGEQLGGDVDDEDEDNEEWFRPSTGDYVPPVREHFGKTDDNTKEVKNKPEDDLIFFTPSSSHAQC